MTFHTKQWLRVLAVLLNFVLAVPVVAGEANAPTFRIAFTSTVSAAPFTGRVFVMLSKQSPKELPSGPNWFSPEPMVAKDVKEWKPGEVLDLGSDALSFPAPVKLSGDIFYAQAVMDFDRGGQSFSACEGNGYSEPVKFVPGYAQAKVDLSITKVYHERPFRETDRIKLADMESKLLSSFHSRPVHMRAGVILPRSYAEHPDRRFPVVYVIPGFGGSHHSVQAAAYSKRGDLPGVEALYVVLDPCCRLGHHVFADSDNNGPWGRALVEEFIPFIERTFRGIGRPDARLVTGHSSGGWSSLWLQITYPDFFGGVWSTAPDPVDFHAMQTVDIYEPAANFFWNADHKPRPVGRSNGKPVLFVKPFSDMEQIMGHGGQLESFEAVFGPRGSDGKPKKLWNRETGAVDPEIAKSWERYDIRLILERDWTALAPRLAGKLHIYCGGEDTFYLEIAVQNLRKTLAKLGSDAEVEIVPGRNHGNLLDQPMRQRIAKEMAEQLAKYRS